MKSFTLLCLVSSALALPATDSYPTYPPAWVAPGPNDVRSPCPLLNSLANHNIIPHDGKNMTIPLLATAFKKYINVGADVAQVVGGNGLLTPAHPNGVSFNLDDLDKHNAIEHDGSLASGDFFYGNDHSFNPLIYTETKAFFTADRISIQTAALARFARVTTSNLTNPTFNLTGPQLKGSFTETPFYLSVFGDPVTANPRTDWVNVFFQEQRLPYAEGWTPRKQETNLTTLGAMAMKVMAATPELPSWFKMDASLTESTH